MIRNSEIILPAKVFKTIKWRAAHSTLNGICLASELFIGIDSTLFILLWLLPMLVLERRRQTLRSSYTYQSIEHPQICDCRSCVLNVYRTQCRPSPKFVPTKLFETNIPQTLLMLSTIIRAHHIMFRIPVLLVHFVCQSRMHSFRIPSFVHQPRVHFAWNKCRGCSCINVLTIQCAAHILYPFAKKNPFRFFSTNSKLHAWNRVRYCMVFAWQTA